MQPLHRLTFEAEPDLVHVRRVVRCLTHLLGFDQRDEVKITAAVSELTRAAGTAVGGMIELGFFVETDDRGSALLIIEVAGPGLVSAARERGSPSAENVVAAEKLLERLPGTTAPAALRFGKRLPDRALPLSGERRAAIRAELKRMDSARTDPSREELLQQSRELAETLLDLEERKQELTTLNAELSDTNRGVMALYAELDERASHLRRADEVKTRFFSHMSHEFRTPLSSILALANMLLDESDGPLLSEQRRQVVLIRDGVSDLLELVSDLLDLAKMEAGKTDVRVGEVAVGTLFGALRAMIRPLLGTAGVALEFEAALELPPLVTDETKIAQILRNFLSNAVKFTERGTITVSARRVPAGERVGDAPLERDGVLFTVADTGIGIAPEHHAAIFEEYRQVESRLQRRARGTGLGLPLCRRLAGLLGGRVWVESALGRGATFYLLVPLVHETAPAEALTSPDARPRLLIVDERADRRAALGATFRNSAFLPIEVAAAEVTPASLATLQPAIALLGAVHTAPAALEALRDAGVPCVSVAGADVTGEGGRAALVAEAYRTVLRPKLHLVLVLDDDEAYRTILTKHLTPFCDAVQATGSWREARGAIRGGTVDCLVLDLIMPEVDGFTVLETLRKDAATAELPVVVCSSKSLSLDEDSLLRRLQAPFLPKDQIGAARVARALVDARRLAAAFSQHVTGSAA